MGKPTVFLEFERLEEGYEPVEKRLRTTRSSSRPCLTTRPRRRVRAAWIADPVGNGCPANNIIPDWNDLVHKGNWRPWKCCTPRTTSHFTGRICPAPCEAACTLGINAAPVGIKSIEHFIIDKGWEMGWVGAEPAAVKTGKKVAIVGSGPAGLAVAQQLARRPRRDRVRVAAASVAGFGIPDFKLNKSVIDRRVAQMEAEGVTFKTKVIVGESAPRPASTTMRLRRFPPNS